MPRLAVIVAALAATLLLPATAMAADNRAAAEELPLNDSVTANTSGFGVQAGEVQSCDGVPYGKTAWYQVQVGDSGRVTLFTTGYDTVVSVYGLGDTQPFGCNDDAFEGEPTSELTFDGDPGDVIEVQVGACCGGAGGNLEVFAFEVSGSDDRAAAQPIPLEQNLARDNAGATEETGESLDCEGHGYGRTVWYRFSAPATGDATVRVGSTGMDPVVSVYRADGTRVGCQDDAPGESRSAEVRVRVGPGEYLVQVGGFEFDMGVFELQVHFAEDLDLDDDGVNRGADCNDGNAGIKPGVPEVVNNDVDENCDNVKEFDRDGDGSRVPGNPADCDDNNPARSPLKPEIVGNTVDENCDGSARAYEVIASRVSAVWDLGKVTKMLDLIVYSARKGSTVTIRCKGRGCPFRGTKRVKVRKKAKQLSVVKKLGKRQRNFRKGAKLIVRLSAPGASPKETIYTIRPKKLPDRSEFCITDRRREC